MVTLLTWALLVMLPAAIFLVMATSLWVSYTRYMDDLRENRGPVEEVRKAKRAKVIIFTFLLFTPVIYGMIVLGLLLSRSGDPTDVKERAIDSGTILLGASLCSALVAQGLLTTFSLKGYLKEREPTPEEISKALEKQRNAPLFSRGRTVQGYPNPFGRTVVILTIPNTIATYGLLVCLMLLSVSGVLGGDAGEASETGEEFENRYGSSIDQDNIEQIEASAWGFAGLALVSVVSGILPLLKKGSIMEKKVIGWRIGLSAAGTLPVIAGLMIMILSMN
ncbi:MAG: hypothetical protein ACMUHB_06045 [Thermoplasmatota archaeon]